MMFNKSAKMFINEDNSKMDNKTISIEDIKMKYKKENLFAKSDYTDLSNNLSNIDKIKIKYKNEDSLFTTQKFLEDRMSKYKREISFETKKIENGANSFKINTNYIDDTSKYILDKLNSIEDTLSKLKVDKNEKNPIAIPMNDSLEKQDNLINKINELINDNLEDDVNNVIPIVDKISRVKVLKQENENKFQMY